MRASAVEYWGMAEKDTAAGRLETGNPSDMGELRRHAREFGYVYCPGLLAAAALVPLRELAMQALSDAGWGTVRAGECVMAAMPDDPDLTAIQPRIQSSTPFAALRRNPSLLTVLGILLGTAPNDGWGDVFRVGFPGIPVWTTPAHQDRSYLRCPERVWTVWVPLVDCPRKLGPLAVLHGSHKKGLQAHRRSGPRGQSLDTQPGDWRSADFSVGDVCFFEDQTIHRALPNRTADQLRLSVDFRFSSVPVPGG